MTTNVLTLFVVQTAAEWFSRGLEVAHVVGLPVTTWRTGDPSRSFYLYIAEMLASLDGPAGEFVRSGFLSTARGEWLKILALELYGVEADEATYAEPTVTLTNTGGGEYTIEAGDLTVRASTLGKTYHSTADVTLLAGETSDPIPLVADEAGSGSTVAEDEIDQMVTTFEGVEIAGSGPGLANDAATDEEIREQCRDSLGALSPNGPADAYEYVAKNSDLTGVSGINRAKAKGSATGAVTVTVASQTGTVPAPTLALIQDAIERWATPLCVNPIVVSAAVSEVDGEYTIYCLPALTATSTEFEAAIFDALDTLFANTPIGGQGGILSEDTITDTIRAVYPGLIYRVTGVEDVELATSEVPERGTIVITRQ